MIDVHKQMVRANGAELYCEVSGSGPTVLFITGGTGGSGHFDRVKPELADEFTIITGFLLYAWLLASVIIAAMIRALDSRRRRPHADARHFVGTDGRSPNRRRSSKLSSLDPPLGARISHVSAPARSATAPFE